ncbi:GTP-binding protein [Moraxella caviae]|uniref:GTP-binding protein n=1 Tax=Moraxella caviae TaxID=34060 RepID=A0A1T0A4T2_9GAMM|nr:GTPase/DUF3482 domain-containing protein [Moraxella caviae]OOR90700.1 GTP-binding protein [Moraxella caviae]STZ14846.1 Predicted GTPase [Moraxella caviae]
MNLHSNIQANNPTLSKICVIGHTNVGKTSLLRTLLRDVSFGEVKNSAATTRHVAEVLIYSLADHHEPLVALYDTPGLEDATGVMDFLQDHTDGRSDGVERLQAFLMAAENQNDVLDGDFSQEAKVIKSLIAADIAMYVIDAREPVLGKYKDELAILASAGTPVLPVFNFVKDGADNMQTWREMLARRGLHVANAFDTVAFDFAGEMSLWQHLALLAKTPAPLEKLSTQRQAHWQDLAEEGSLLIADFLVNVASFQEKISQNDDPTPTLLRMQDIVRHAEENLQSKLLDKYRFYHAHIDTAAADVLGQKQDLFDGELLAHYGIRTAGGSVTGMLIGAGFDVATLGASLGLGTAIGGVIGGLLPNTSAIKDKALGVQTLTIDDATLTLLAARAQNLHHALRHRGHASLDAVRLHGEISLPWQSDKLPAMLKKARLNPQYSNLQDGANGKQNLRASLAEPLAQLLETHLLGLK